jgi:hypothetical protein
VSTLGDQIVVNCYAQVGAHNHGQWQSFGGRLLEATALSVEFAIDACDDILLERRLEPKTGLPILNRVENLSGESMVDRSDSLVDTFPADTPAPDPTPQPAPKAEEPPAASAPVDSGNAAVQASADSVSAAAVKEPKPAAKATPSQPRRRATSATSEAAGTTTANTAPPEVVRRPSWGDAIEYSSKSREKAKLGIEEDKSSKNLDTVVDWPDAPDIRPGDLLEHPHFGLCKVIYVEEDNFVRVRKRNRKVVDIKLEVCDIEPSGNKDGKRLFTCNIVSR